MESKEKRTKTSIQRQEEESFHVVAIGTSAGGLDALQTFFSHVPPSSGLAFVIIQHLDPEHKSMMADILRKYTSMRIQQVKAGMKIKPNHVYLNPAHKEASLFNQTFYLTDPARDTSAGLTIDHFLRSLSRDQGEKAICVILSGTGSDGANGLKEIKAEGGMAMVQDEKEAKYDGMPRSAIATTLVDYVLPVSEMPEKIMEYIHHPATRAAVKPDTLNYTYQRCIEKILMLIRSYTNHDFSDYKRTNIIRRIERRMALLHIEEIRDYVQHLTRNKDEINALSKDLLIRVTSFFRDPEAFDAFKKKAIVPLLQKRLSDLPIRVWIPGCSTGEEAYSIAMVMAEVLEESRNRADIQIFATDIDPDVVQHSRLATYTGSIEADISRGRLERFFIKRGNFFVVKKHIREMIVFATQNLIKDPPFSRLDLVSCRNILIYMNAVLQTKILSLFHYILNEGGFLFLGSSEGVGEFTDHFSAVDKKWKIFQRRKVISRKQVCYSTFPSFDTRKKLLTMKEKKMMREKNFRELVEGIVLQDYAPASVLVNDKFEILYFQGQTDRYLVPPKGEASFNVLRMVREDLRYQLSAALQKVTKQKRPVSSEEIQLQEDDTPRTVDLVVRPLTDSVSTENLMLIIFNDRMPLQKTGRKKKDGTDDETDARLMTLKQELESTRNNLRTTIEELEIHNEELQSTNEELQSTNEELQSTNEELETTKEELQSANEELATVNQELHKKVEELCRANNDINNLLVSTEIGTIFLDTSLCVKRFTPAAARVFNLIPTDVGRPISDITSKIRYEGLKKDAEKVLNTLACVESEFQSERENYFTVRILPYRTVENVIDGVIITFTDITKTKRTEQALKASEKRYKDLFNDAPDMIHIVDKNGFIIDANETLLQITGYSSEEYLGKQLLNFIPPDYHQVTRESLEFALNNKKHTTYETVLLLKEGGKILVEVNAIPQIDGGEAVAARTFSRYINESSRITERDSLLATVIKEANDAIIIHDFNGQILAWNHGAERIYGYPETEAVNMNIFDIVPDLLHNDLKTQISLLSKGLMVESVDTERIAKNSQIRQVCSNGSLLTDRYGTPIAIATIERDNTPYKQLERKYQKRIKQLEQSVEKMRGKTKRDNYDSGE